MRKITKKVMCRDIPIGGGAAISIQSMTTTDTADVKGTLFQIRELEKAGCQIVRVAVPNMKSAEALPLIRKGTEMPLVADIHFDYHLALAAIEAGFDKIRINPGNIGSEENVRAVIKLAKARNIPIRIGVNAGSLEKEIIKRDGGITPDGLAESVLKMVERVEAMDFDNIVISVKASDVRLNYETCKKVSELTDYPLHIGVTESGIKGSGTIKSAVGIGALLLEGIGDTIRVSLTGDPLAEIPVAREILRCTGNFDHGIEYVSCPTCARCKADLPNIAIELKNRLSSLENKLVKEGKPKLTVAIMGCAVNGPGESKLADIGVAFGDGKGVIFSKGKVICKASEESIVNVLIEKIEEEIYG